MLQKASCPLSHTHTCTPTVFFLFGETALATKDYLLSYCITKICFEQILTILYLHMAKLTAQKNGYTLIEKTKKKDCIYSTHVEVQVLIVVICIPKEKKATQFAPIKNLISELNAEIIVTCNKS